MPTCYTKANLFPRNPEFMERKKFRRMGLSIYVDALSSYQHRNCPRLGCPFFARADKDYCKLEISVNGNTATMERVS